jgi:hypothetical protein
VKKLLMPMSTKLAPAVTELRSRLQSVGLEATVEHVLPSAEISNALSDRAARCAPQPVNLANTGHTVYKPTERPALISLPSPRLPAISSSRVPQVTSPRIAASKAFFDNGAKDQLTPAGKGVSSRPLPRPVQQPSWQRHRPSQSLPVVPKQSSMLEMESGPSWLKSPILSRSSALAKPVANSGGCPTTDNKQRLPSTHIAPPLRAPFSNDKSSPAPVSEPLTQDKPRERTMIAHPAVQSTFTSSTGPSRQKDRQDDTGPSKMNPPQATRKVSAAILRRSRSFRQEPRTVASEGSASGTSDTASPPLMVDLARKNAAIRSRSPVTEKRTSPSAEASNSHISNAHEVLPEADVAAASSACSAWVESRIRTMSRLSSFLNKGISSMHIVSLVTLARSRCKMELSSSSKISRGCMSRCVRTGYGLGALNYG